MLKFPPPPPPHPSSISVELCESEGGGLTISIYAEDWGASHFTNYCLLARFCSLLHYFLSAQAPLANCGAIADVLRGTHQ